MRRLSTDWGTRNSTGSPADHPTDVAAEIGDSCFNAGETGEKNRKTH
jgi:hypothetical protein